MSPDHGFPPESTQPAEQVRPASLGSADLLPSFQDVAFGETAHVSFGALTLDAKMRVINKGYGLFSLGGYTAEVAPTDEQRAEALAAFEAQQKSQS